jgi:putative transcriptional regulator
MNTVKISIDPENPASLPEGRVDFNRLDDTNEQDIAAQQHIDEVNTMLDAAKFARRTDAVGFESG